MDSRRHSYVKLLANERAKLVGTGSDHHFPVLTQFDGLKIQGIGEADEQQEYELRLSHVWLMNYRLFS